MTKRKRKPVTNYLDNEKFLNAIVDYKKQLQAWKDEYSDEVFDEENKLLSNDEIDPSILMKKPQISNYIGDCILKMANGLCTRPNFNNYAFREEMIMDGVENCLRYLDRFDETRTQNPFGYFTRTLYFAFVRRIQKEKKLLYTKIKYIDKVNIFDETSEKHSANKFDVYQDEITVSDYTREYADDFVRTYEEKNNIKSRGGLKT